MPPASPFATGDELVHLEKGLARVTEIKHSAGTLHLVVAIGKQTIWIPVDAWREHVRALPTRKEAEQWRTRAMTGPIMPGGAAIARRREITVGHRDFAAKLAALADAYRSGDRSGDADYTLERLEDHVLPIIARALGRPVDPLRDELRAAMPAVQAPAPPSPLPDLGARFEPIGRATLGAKTVVGDPGSYEVELATLPGEWLGYRWSAHDRDEFGRLVAVHADHVGNLAALLAARTHVGRPICDAASALVYDPAIVDDPAAVDEIYDPVEPGLISGRGFLLSLGGDGRYDASAAKYGTRIACIVAGEEPSELESRLLRGEARERVAIEELEAWAPASKRAYDPTPLAALAILAEPPPSPAKVAALEQFVERLDRELEAEVDGDRDLVVQAIEHLAVLAPEPRPWFDRLVAEFERPAPAVAYAIARVLVATRRRDFGDLVLARLASEAAPWRSPRLSLLRAVLRAGHPAAVATLLDDLAHTESAWARVQTAATLLQTEPTSCEFARMLIEHVETYSEQDRSKDPPNAGYGSDWDELFVAMTPHVSSCAACRLDWVKHVFRAKRADLPEMRRLVVIAPEHLAGITGAHTDDELWRWIAAQDPK